MRALLTIISISIIIVIIITIVKVRHISDQAPGFPSLHPESSALADNNENGGPEVERTQRSHKQCALAARRTSSQGGHLPEVPSVPSNKVAGPWICSQQRRKRQSRRAQELTRFQELEDSRQEEECFHLIAPTPPTATAE